MKGKPRWSTVTIALAMIAALAIASPVLGVSKSLKTVIKRIADNEIDTKAPRLSVGHAASADSATTATTASSSDGPAAYAYITGSTGGVASSRGITDAMVQHTPGTGIYCIHDLGFAVKSVMVSPALTNTTDANNVVRASVGNSQGDCNAFVSQGVDRVISVRAQNANTSTAADTTFYIWVAR